MPKRSGNISLSSYDDIFQTDQSREEAQQERVQEIPLSELHPFKGHPFKVLDDDAMQKTVESIAQFGVMTPAIARPRPEGGYELIAGHRRHHASELAGKETMPVIVRDMDDDAATILMVDSNLQRETLLPSERAFAYKMKLEAIKHQGSRGDLTSAQVGQKSWAVHQVADESGESKTNVFFETFRSSIRQGALMKTETMLIPLIWSDSYYIILHFVYLMRLNCMRNTIKILILLFR